MPLLAAPLPVILGAELAAGNAVAEASTWPPRCELLRCELLLVLRQPCGRPHPVGPGVTYHLLNAPPYWLAEYCYDGGRQVPACRLA